MLADKLDVLEESFPPEDASRLYDQRRKHMQRVYKRYQHSYSGRAGDRAATIYANAMKELDDLWDEFIKYWNDSPSPSPGKRLRHHGGPTGLMRTDKDIVVKNMAQSFLNLQLRSVP